jgi:transcriptional regulator GlxA family with amidase domain
VVERGSVVRVQIALFDGVDPLDAVAPYEVLWAAGELSEGRVAVELGAAEGARRVPTGSGVVLDATARLDARCCEVLLVPGAAGRLGEGDDEPGDDTIPARLARALDSELGLVLRDAFASPDVVVACVCGGSLLPAMAGLTEGRPAVTHHMGMDLLDATGTTAIAARVVDDGDLVTGGGVTSGLDVALHLVDRFVGPQVAHAVESLFEYERRGIVWRRAGPVPTPL